MIYHKDIKGKQMDNPVKPKKETNTTQVPEYMIDIIKDLPQEGVTRLIEEVDMDEN